MNTPTYKGMNGKIYSNEKEKEAADKRYFKTNFKKKFCISSTYVSLNEVLEDYHNGSLAISVDENIPAKEKQELAELLNKKELNGDLFGVNSSDSISMEDTPKYQYMTSGSELINILKTNPLPKFNSDNIDIQPNDFGGYTLFVNNNGGKYSITNDFETEDCYKKLTDPQKKQAALAIKKYYPLIWKDLTKVAWFEDEYDTE